MKQMRPEPSDVVNRCGTTLPKPAVVFSAELKIRSYSFSLMPGLVKLMFVLAERGLSLVLLFHYGWGINDPLFGYEG